MSLKRVAIAHFKRQSIVAVSDNFGNTARPSGDHRHRAGRGLQERHAQPLALSRMHDGIEVWEYPSQVIAKPCHLDPPSKLGTRNTRCKCLTQRPLSKNKDVESWETGEKIRQDVQKIAMTFSRNQLRNNAECHLIGRQFKLALKPAFISRTIIKHRINRAAHWKYFFIGYATRA